MRLLVLVLAVIAVGVVPALATDGAVQTTPSFTFSPKEIAVKPGEKVTFANPDGGFHNVHFEDGQHTVPATPSSSWPVNERTFTTEGTFRYYCDAHGAPGGSGMSGVVYVNASGTVPSQSPSPTTTAATPSPTAYGLPTPTPTAAATRTFAVKAAERFCVRKSRRCKKPGIVLRVTANAGFAVTGKLLKSTKAAGTLRLTARAGTRTLRFRTLSGGRRLRAGSYRLVLRGAGVTRTVRFRLTS